MTSDHWLPVLQLSPAPIGEGSSSVVIINIHYDPANDNYSHAAMEGSSHKEVSCDQQIDIYVSNQISNVQKNVQLTQFTALIIALRIVPAGQSGHVYKMPILRT